MKSKVFSNFDVSRPENQGFRADFAALAKLSPESLEKAVDMIPTLILATGADVGKQKLNLLISTLPEEGSIVRSAVNCLKNLFQAFGDEEFSGEEPDVLAADAVEASVISPERQAQVAAALARLKTHVQANEQLTRREDALAGPVPLLRGVSTSVDMRAVKKRRYRDVVDPAVYEPEILDFTGVASVKLRSSTEGDDFLFQTNRAGLEFLLRILSATLRELDAAEGYWLANAKDLRTRENSQ